jgi:UDP-N-acetylmuramate--alanine ligase
LDPTVINGGIINSYGTNARLGDGDWMVVEADESDGTFVKVPSTISVVTNIDPEHLDHWKNFDQLREAFKNFVQNIPFYGFAVLCIDHPEVQALIGKVTDRRIFTFGFSPQADVRAVNVRTEIGQSTFDVVIRERVDSAERVIRDVRLPMVGDHNVSNSLAAITVALELGIPDDKIVSAFDGFTGVKRRFTKTGEVDGVTIIDDYGHHPVEIKAVLKAARKATQNNVIAVVQPHRYSRLHDLFEEFCTCFNDADSVIVADVYEAGESPIEGANRDALVDGLRNRGHRHVAALEGPEALASMIAKEAKPGDLVVCLGAGSISAWANALPAQLEALKN